MQGHTGGGGAGSLITVIKLVAGGNSVDVDSGKVTLEVEGQAYMGQGDGHQSATADRIQSLPTALTTKTKKESCLLSTVLVLTPLHCSPPLRLIRL